MDKYQHFTIGDLCKIEKGETGIASAIAGDYPLVNTGAERKSCNTYQFDIEAVCIPLVSSTGHGKKTLNYVHYQKGKFALGTILAAVIPKDQQKLSAAFLHRYLQFYKDQKIVPLMKGAANVSLAIKDIAKIEVPVPPIIKQKSFIELFNKLTDSNIKLQSEFLNQSSYISLLRQAVRQEAIAGKLTANWRKKHPELISGENHASKLLEKIKVEKELLIQEGKIRKEKLGAPIKQEDKAFILPFGWIFTNIHFIGAPIANAIVDGPFGSHLVLSDYDKNGKYPVITIGCIDEGFDFYKLRKVNEAKFQQIKRSTIIGGDLLVAKIGSSYGKLGEYPEDAPKGIIPANLLKITVNQRINKQFIKVFLKSLFYKKQLDAITQFHAQPAFNMKNFKTLIIPLPPIAEQQAIVERVDKLMAKIDELEKQVTERKDKSERLMQSVLREAFEQ